MNDDHGTTPDTETTTETTTAPEAPVSEATTSAAPPAAEAEAAAPTTDTDDSAQEGGFDTDGRVVDEAAWAAENDDEDDDDGPLHFGGDLDAVDDDEVGDDADGEAAPANAHQPELEITLNADAEIPLAQIDEDALWVVKRLRAKGYEAYLTGGCVRDLLLGRTPKDFDVATAAHPNQVRAVFRNCRLVGRRFRLAHVFFPSGKVIETATFRANPTDTLEDLPEDLLVERDNVFGNVEEDARRRDLTINGLFYDPVAGKVLDYVDGRTDLEKRLIRTIGDPSIRFQEDPVRILRVIKFATRLGFEIESATWDAMCQHSGELLRCAPARLQEELLRLLASTHARESWALAEKCGVTRALLPELLDAFANPPVGDSPAPAMQVNLAPSASPMTVVAPATGDEAETTIAVAEPPADAVTSAAVETDATPTDLAATDATPADVAAVDASPAAVDAVDASPAEVDVAGADAEGAEGGPAADEAAAPLPAPTPAPQPLVFPALPDVAAREARLLGLLGALDLVRSRDADLTSALAFAMLAAPVWESLGGDAEAFEAWWNPTCDAWTERLRFTRHDRERVPQLLAAQLDLDPTKRRGHAARVVVSRPSFREALLLLILRLQGAEMSLDEVGRWKVVAAHYGANYQQPRYNRNRQRAAARSPGGGDRRGRGRDRDRGRGRSGGGNGGGGGGRRRR